MDVSQQAEIPGLSSKCPQFFKIAVLSSDFNLLSYALFGLDEVDGGRCDDHLCLLNVIFIMSYPTRQPSMLTSGGVEISLIQSSDKRRCVREACRIQLEVSSDKKLTRHDLELSLWSKLV